MINSSLLIDNGYGKFTGAMKFDKDSTCIASYQKGIQDENGVKFYIDLNEYDLSHILPASALPKHQFSATVQFVTDDTFGNRFDAGLHVDAENMSIQDVEAFYDKLWGAMSCSYND